MKIHSIHLEPTENGCCVEVHGRIEKPSGNKDNPMEVEHKQLKINGDKEIFDHVSKWVETKMGEGGKPKGIIDHKKFK